MQQKLKKCAGFDGVEHEAYIYKNIDGKKYCKSCTFKLQKPKPIKKRTEKQVFKMTLKTELFKEDMDFYKLVWQSRFPLEGLNGTSYIKSADLPHCEACWAKLGEMNLCNFHHILEKRNYPEYRHHPHNIAIVCFDCHNKYETMPDQVPYLQEQRRNLIESHHEMGMI